MTKSPQTLPEKSDHGNSRPTSSEVCSPTTLNPTASNVHTSINQTALVSERFVIAFRYLVLYPIAHKTAISEAKKILERNEKYLRNNVHTGVLHYRT